MPNDSENRPGSATFSLENDKPMPAGWNTPKPEFIPAPTYWPFLLSLGSTLMGLGVLTSTIITATGIVLFTLAIAKWVGEFSSDDR